MGGQPAEACPATRHEADGREREPAGAGAASPDREREHQHKGHSRAQGGRIACNPKIEIGWGSVRARYGHDREGRAEGYKGHDGGKEQSKVPSPPLSAAKTAGHVRCPFRCGAVNLPAMRIIAYALGAVAMKHIALTLGRLAGAGVLCLAVAVASMQANAAAAADLTLRPITFTANDGTEVAAEKGAFAVPENRSDPGSRMITLKFVRFPATTNNPGPPIVYLAGGPGGSGSGTAEGRRFPLFMALRGVADVIAFDQRGTGLSSSVPGCDSQVPFPKDQAVTRERRAALLREAAAVCAAFWEGEGVDINGYTTAESAADLMALREALGVKTIDLWGISYGTHLALAAIRAYPDHIGRAVLASAEGLDQTVKLPARTDAYFTRVQAAIDRNPEMKAAYPDVAGLLRKIIANVKAEPPLVSFSGRNGEEVRFVLSAADLQIVTGGSISDPFRLEGLLSAYSQMEGGDFSALAPLVYGWLHGETVRLRGMPEAMDVASGISQARADLVAEQAQSSLLGDMLNFPMPHMSAADLGMTGLGADFRAPFETDVPALFLSGTLDGRTYPESHREVAAQFTNAAFVTVDNAGHNLFMVSEEVQARVIAFLGREPVPETPIGVAPPFARAGE